MADEDVRFDDLKAVSSTVGFNVDQAVRERYAAGAQQREAMLCCPTSYDPTYLKILPQEILERDYGCGDPSEHVGKGETVLDLGSGGGKVCYILSQKVGPNGRVIGVDVNDEMLALARKYQDEMAQKIGHANVSFRKGRIQDLRLDLDKAEAWLKRHPVTDHTSLCAFEAECDRLRRDEPLIPDNSVDAVVSNCVLNLVAPEQKVALFKEIFRVLKRGGRAVISDIVCDEPPTKRILDDPELWSGCISGAFLEHEFPVMFERAGFYGIEILKREDKPWQTIDGIEFRSMTIRAYKGKQGPCLDRNQAAVYLGPWKQVVDDDGHTYFRGQRMAVCDKTFKLLTDPNGPYAGQFAAVEPLSAVPLDDAPEYDCRRNAVRNPRVTKGVDYRANIAADHTGDCCSSQGCC
ncbi:MAG: methyltransferase domain-containing protein [Phycisphaeraceae bacterium]